MMEHVWVVEVSWEVRGRFGPWRPVVGIGLDRTQGRQRMREWKQRNPHDRFRLRKYARTGWV
jgi:hypothetical protein